MYSFKSFRQLAKIVIEASNTNLYLIAWDILFSVSLYFQKAITVG